MPLSISDLKYIPPSTLASLLRSRQKRISIIDVRDTDYIGGHIVTSQNVPTQTHDFALPELARKLADREVVVFHCALSQQRGPRAALGYLRERERLAFSSSSFAGDGGAKKGEIETGTETGDGNKRQEVFVLQGGFAKWQELYGEDKELTEDYQKDIWEFGY